MKLSFLPLLVAAVLALAFVPSSSRAAYQSAQVALQKLEGFETLTPDQEKQARQIYQNLKDVMDSMSVEERPAKGAQSRQDALAAIRAILTPEQQAVYDQTPQRLGGGLKGQDPAMRALNQQIRTFVTSYARGSAEIAAQVGAIQKVSPVANGSSTVSDGSLPDPALHPQGGTNQVSVTGSGGTKNFKITWTMSSAGEMAVSKVEAVAD